MKKRIILSLLIILIFSSSFITPLKANEEELQVKNFDDSFRVWRYGEYEITVYYPIDDQAPYPIIVFAHGFLSDHRWSSWVGDLAKEGYIVITFTVPDRASPDLEQWIRGIEGCIEYLKTANNRRWPRSALYNKVDSECIGVIGHSFGAMASLVVASSNPDVKAAIIIEAPYLKGMQTGNEVADPILNAMDWDQVYLAAGELTVPVQFHVGTLDVFSYGNSRVYFEAVQSSEKEYILIEGGNHINYLDPIKALDALDELIDLFLDLPEEVISYILPSDVVQLLNLMFLVPYRIRVNLMRSILSDFINNEGLEEITIIDFAVGIGIDNHAQITPEEQQEESLGYIIEWFDDFLS